MGGRTGAVVAAGRGGAPRVPKSLAPVPVPPFQARPYISTLEFGAFPSAVPCARLHARAILREWDLTETADTIELVVSELVTNAVAASECHDGQPTYERRAGLPAVVLRLSAQELRVLVEVWDDAPTGPIRRDSRHDEERGRGLMLVEALAERWGYYAPQHGFGKVVWAEVAITPVTTP